jgi:hypothetical protein
MSRNYSNKAFREVLACMETVTNACQKKNYQCLSASHSVVNRKKKSMPAIPRLTSAVKVTEELCIAEFIICTFFSCASKCVLVLVYVCVCVCVFWRGSVRKIDR